MDIWSFVENAFIEIACPACGIHRRITARDVYLGRSVFCPACEIKIKLKDKDASTINANREIKQFESQFKDIFKNFNQ